MPDSSQVFTHTYSYTQDDFDRFAILSGDDNPIHVDPAFAAHTKFGRTVAHGMLLFSSLHARLLEHFPNLVLVAQDLIFPSPTYVGESLTLRLEALPPLPGATKRQVVTTLERPGGEFGLQGHAHLAPVEVLLSIAGDSPAAQASPADFLPGPRAWRGLQLGQRAETRRSFTTADLQMYCELAGGCHALYRETRYARQAGFQDQLVPPGLIGGLVSFLLGTRLPGRSTNWLKQAYTFPAAACLGEELRAWVEITRLRPEKALVNLRAGCANAANKLLCAGETLVLVKDLETR